MNQEAIDFYSQLILDKVLELFAGQAPVLDADEVNLNDFFTGFVAAFCTLENRLCGRRDDLLNATYLANRLVVQYMVSASNKGKLRFYPIEK